MCKWAIQDKNSQVFWWQRLLAGLQKTRIQESETKWTKKHITLLPFKFNFPKLDYFANKNIVWWPEKDSNSRIRSKNYYISNGPLFNFPNRNLKTRSMRKWAFQHIISQIFCLQAIYSQFWLDVQNMKIRWIYLFSFFVN